MGALRWLVQPLYQQFGEIGEEPCLSSILHHPEDSFKTERVREGAQQGVDAERKCFAVDTRSGAHRGKFTAYRAVLEPEQRLAKRIVR